MRVVCVIAPGMFRRFGLEQVRRQHRRQRQRQHQRDEQRDRDGERQRREHLALHALQRHQRQEHQDDDADPEDHRRGHLRHGMQDDAHAALVRVARLGQMRERVLDHHHRAVHHQADGDRQPAQRHQVGRDAQPVHRHEGQQRRQHQRADHDQRRPDVAQEQQQHQHHQHHALEQHLDHRVERRIDQLGALVIRHDLQAVGQHAVVVDGLDARLDARDDFLGVAAAHHHDHAADRFGHAVLDHRPRARRRADLHLGHVAQGQRRAAHFLEHDGADVVDVAHQAHAADQVLLGKMRQHAAARVGVVGGQRLEHLLHRHVVVAQPLGIDQHLVLLLVAALRVDLRHARNGAQQRPHHPVLGDAAAGQLVGRQFPAAVVRTIERVLVDLAQPRGHRPQHRRHAHRHARLHFDDALHHQLAREVHVGLVAEHQRDQRQAGLVQRAHLCQRRQAGHRHLHRYGDEALDLLGRAPGRLGGDLHLHVGHVRKRIQRQLAGGVDAEEQQHGGHHGHHQPLLERAAYQCVDHAPSISARLRSLLRWKPPSTTIGCPACRPEATGRTPFDSSPSFTGTSR